MDTIADFNTGQGDKIDITDVLSGSGYNPGTHTLSDWVSIVDSGGNGYLYVDQDGVGGTYSPVAIATIFGVTGLDVSDLVTNGNLIVPT